MSSEAHSGLQIEEDLRAQQKLWIFQRWGSAFMGSVILASLIGVLAPGPISDAVKRSGSLEVRYEKVLHYRDNGEVEIEVDLPAEEKESFDIDLSRDFVKAMNIEAITPEPVRTESREGLLRYRFSRDTGAGKRLVVFHFKPDERGLIRGKVSVPSGETVNLQQFVFP